MFLTFEIPAQVRGPKSQPIEPHGQPIGDVSFYIWISMTGTQT